MITLIYPSCRDREIVPACRRARGHAGLELRIVVGCNGDKKLCQAAIGCADLVIWFGEERFNPPYVTAVNRIFRAAVKRYVPADDELFGYWSDDFFPQSGWAHWIQNARQQHPNKRVVLARDGLMNGNTAATIPFICYSWLRDCNGGMFWPPIYKYVVDVEPYRKAQAMGELFFAHHCCIDHHHPFVKTREFDEVDKHNAITDNDDWNLIDRRHEQGYPVTWEDDKIRIDQEVPESCQTANWVEWT